MNRATELRKIARELGWKPLRSNGKHEVYVSQSGNRMPLPTSPKGGSQANIISKLKRYQ